MPIVRKPTKGLHEGDYTLIPKELFTDSRLSVASKSVYGVIAMLDTKGEELSIERISEVAQIPKKLVLASLRELEGANWVSGVDYDS